MVFTETREIKWRWRKLKVLRRPNIHGLESLPLLPAVVDRLLDFLAFGSIWVPEEPALSERLLHDERDQLAWRLFDLVSFELNLKMKKMTFGNCTFIAQSNSQLALFSKNILLRVRLLKKVAHCDQYSTFVHSWTCNSSLQV